MYDITADKKILVDVFYSKITLNSSQQLPFKISSKYDRIY